MDTWIWVVGIVVVVAGIAWLSWWRAGRKSLDDAGGQTRSGQFGSGVESGYWGNQD